MRPRPPIIGLAESADGPEEIESLHWARRDDPDDDETEDDWDDDEDDEEDELDDDEDDDEEDDEDDEKWDVASPAGTTAR